RAWRRAAASRARGARAGDRRRLDLARADGDQGAGIRGGLRVVPSGGRAQQPERGGAQRPFGCGGGGGRPRPPPPLAPARPLAAARDWLRTAAAREPRNPAVRIELSRLLAVTGDAPGAVQAAVEALQLVPDEPRAAEQLASVFADTSDAQRLAPLADLMVERF